VRLSLAKSSAQKLAVALVSFRYLGAVLAVALAITSRAAAAPHEIALDYVAPAVCPNAAEFQQEIQHFLPELSVVSSADAPARFAVSIDDSGTAGELRVLSEPNGGARRAQAADCAEVARLLAFAIALVLDPNLRIAEEPADDSDAAIEPASEPAISPQPPAIASAPPVTLPQPPGPRARARPRSRSLKHRLGAMGFVASATSPTPTYGVGARYDLAARFGSLEPELRFGGSYSTSADAVRDGATVTFVNVLGLLEACPATLHAASLDFLPCLRVDAGARNTKGRGIANAKNQARPWLSFDAVVHVRWHLARPVLLELGAAAVFPAWHDRVFFQPDLTVHQVPNVGWLGEIALLVEFPDQNRN
jgi:hypothetical protein